MTTYRHTPEMGEISGFGGDYEQACQDMLEAGVLWLDKHSEADLRAHGYKGVFGFFVPDSDDAKTLEAEVIAHGQGPSGAMVHAVMNRLFYIAKHGWDNYCREVVAEEET